MVLLWIAADVADIDLKLRVLNEVVEERLLHGVHRLSYLSDLISLRVRRVE